MSQIPYATPSGYSPSPGRRPTAVLVIGILGIVLGAFGTLGGFCGVLYYFVPVHGTVPDPLKDAMQHDTLWRMTALSLTALQFVLSALLLCGSIFALAMRGWARKMLLVYGWGQIIGWVIITAINVGWLIPRATAVLKEHAANPVEQKWMQGSQWVGHLLCGLLWPLFAALVLILMTRPMVKAAFAGRPWAPLSGGMPPINPPEA